MGRAERRRAERTNRIEGRKGKILVSREELNKMKRDITHDAAGYNTEALMTCFALALYRVHGFKQKRIAKTLEYIDGLMTDILTDKATMEDYIKELEDETCVIVKCED